MRLSLRFVAIAVVVAGSVVACGSNGLGGLGGGGSSSGNPEPDPTNIGQQARVDLKQILNLQTYASDALSMTDPDFLAHDHPGHAHDHVCDDHCAHDHEHEHDHQHGHGQAHRPVIDHGHAHDPSVASVSFTFDGRFDADHLMRQINEVLAIRGDDIFRVKGIFAIEGDERRHVLQGVHRLVELKPSLPWWDETPASKVVFIGRHLQAQKLRARLQACLVPHESEALEAA